MDMSPKDWKIHSVTRDGAFVVAEHGTTGMTWPSIIFDEKTARKFRFEFNEKIPLEIAKFWGGYAYYSEVPEDEGI